ncbi:MAG: hypothetical protein ACM3SQ_15810, partial [Betaproteobacteria bacterium]
QIATQLSSFPIGSSAGGFSFTFDPSLGTFNRSTDSFGPVFAERALTNGRGRVTIGGNFEYAKYNSFEGTDLTNGDVKFYLRHEAETGAFYEKDLVQAALHLDLSIATTTVFVNYGVTNNWDVAVAVPFQRVSMDASVDATVLPLASADLNPPIHAFPGGSLTKTFTSSGKASGVGDVLLRTKYRFLSRPGGGLALGVDVRLPSGDANNLLGTGTTEGTFTLIGSSTAGRLAPHFNVAYTTAGTGKVVQNIPSEFDYRFGTEIVAGPRVTFVGDFLGRSLRDAGRLRLTDTVWNYANEAGVPGSTTLHEFAPVSGALNLLSAALGAKVNVAGNLLISGNVLIALNSQGVTARLVPVFGVDYSF